MASNLVNPIHPVLVAFVEDIANNFKAFKMNEICRHLKLQATLEDFSDFIYAKEQLCGEELKMDRQRSDAFFFAVSDVFVRDKWGETFHLKWMDFVAGHCLTPATLPPIFNTTGGLKSS